MRTSKKLLSLFLSAVLCLSLLPAMAWADEPVSTQGEFATACTNAQSGDTIKLGDGTFYLSGLSQNLTIEGNGADTVLYIGSSGDGNQGKGIFVQDLTLKNLTLNQNPEYLKNTYIGFTGGKNLTFDNVFFAYGFSNWGNTDGSAVKFINCDFKQTNSSLYNVQELRSDNETKYLFDGCTFDSVGGRFINAYKQGGQNASIEIVVKDCAFNGTNKGKAALNLKTGYSDGCNIVLYLLGNNTATNVATGSKTGLELFDDNDNHGTVYQGTTKDAAVKIWENGKKVSTNFFEKDSSWHIANLAGLKEFAEAANGGNTLNGETVVLDADIDLAGETWPMIDGAGKNITFDGQNHTISNMVTPTDAHNGGFFSTGCYCTIKNVNFDKATVVGIGRLGVVCGHGMCVAIENCKVTNSTVTAVVTNNDDGDKAGAICGYLSGESVAYVKGCTVEDCTITGYRDIGGAVGYAGGTFEVTNTAVKNTKVVNNQGNNYKNYTEDTQYDIGAVIGEATEDGTKNNNTETNVTVEVLKVAAIGETKYTTLQAAIDAAVSGDTVTLLDNIVFTDADVNDVNNNDYIYSISGNKTLTIDGAGHTITGNLTNAKVGKANGTYVFQITNTGTTNFKNLTILCAETNAGTVKGGLNFADNAGASTVTNCVIKTSDLHHSNADWNVAAIVINHANVTVNGGEYYGGKVNGQTPDYQGINVDKNGSLTFNSGKTNGIKVEGGSATVAGGEHSKEVKAVSPGTLSLTGGLYSVKPADTYVASGYAVRDNGDGTYTVYRPSSGDGSSTTKTETTTNADGSKTTTTTDTKTGAVTETTTKTETAANGTKTETKVEVVTQKDGTVTEKQTETATAKNGTTATKVETTDAAGKTETKVEAKVTAAAVTEAKTADKPVTIPVTVESTKSAETAATVSVSVPKSAGSTKVEVPVTNVTAGTVAVLVKADGTEEIIKTSVLTEDGVALKVEGDVQIKIIDNTKEFTDVVDNHWAGDAIDFATSHEIFNGTGDKSFAPEATMTRAMLFTVLARFDDAPVVTTGENWYAGSMEWAKTNGVSDGTNPEASISREQLATMLYRYAGAPAVTGDLAAFGDAATVSDYAAAAMQWAVSVGLINGIGGNLEPQGFATRAQLAAIMQRFCTNVAF